MTEKSIVQIDTLPNWWRLLFRPRDNDRHAFQRDFSVADAIFELAPAHMKTDKARHQFGVYVAERDKSHARPLRHLLARSYTRKSGLDLLELQTNSVIGVGAAMAAKLARINIITVDDLSKCPTNKLIATGIPKDKLALVRAYAKDIAKHATMPEIVECPLSLNELIKPKFLRTPTKELLGLRLYAIRGIGKATAKKCDIAGVATKIEDLENAGSNELVAAGASPREVNLMLDYSAMIAGYADRAEQRFGGRPALGTLRVLIYDGVLELPNDSRLQPEYPLDNPNYNREPEEIAEEPYIGYIIAADDIVVTDDIFTRGNDLILAAKTIQVGKTGAITINTTPDDFATDPDAGSDGLNADNGGDLVFLSQHIALYPNSSIVTSGGKGQNGGCGKDATKYDYLQEGVHFETPQRRGSIAGVFTGEEQCKFKIRQSDDPYEAPTTHIIDDNGRWNYPTTYEGYHNRTWGPHVKIAGEWTLRKSISAAAARFILFMKSLPDICYPTAGGAGGYGGNPGKISLVVPDPSEVIGTTELCVEALTGVDGAPGRAGKGGDCTPDQIRRRGGELVPIVNYISEYTTQKAEVDFRGEPGDPFEGGLDRFQNLTSERLDSGVIADKLEDSICSVKFGADLFVLYHSNLVDMRKNVWRQRYVWMGFPWPHQIGVSAVRSNAIHCAPISNSIPPPMTESLGLYLDDATNECKPALAATTERLCTISKNWYRAVFELIPEYPLRQYEQADAAYRRGDFEAAAEHYNVVLSFAHEVPDFLADHPNVVRDASYRSDKISNGYDYFGFITGTIIPSSPTRDYFPLPLTTAYSDTVQYYSEAIRENFDSIVTIEQGRDTIRQFLVRHDRIVADIRDSIESQDIELLILESETHALQREINALQWSNQRQNGILKRWSQRVDEKIKELQKEKEDEGEGWWNLLIFIWTGIKLVSSIISFGASIADAISAFADAQQKIGNVGDCLNDLRIASWEIVSNIADWDSEQISEYLDAMGGVVTEIENWVDVVEPVWKEADKRLQAVKKAYKETEKKLDELTAVDMTEEEATDFQNDVLLAEEIGVSGGITYLQIQEQINLNNDMINAKYKALEALTQRRIQQGHQLFALLREMAAYKAEARYVDELLGVYTWDINQKRAALKSLIGIGQNSLDGLMHRLARQNRQLNFLSLDENQSPGFYAYSIDEPHDVSTVLGNRVRLIGDMREWIESNNNIGRLKVAVTNDSDYDGNIGGITVVDSAALDKFSSGRYLRPSRLTEIEPLRETELVARLAQAVEGRRFDPVGLADLLVSQFIVEQDGVHYIVSPDALGFGVSPQVVGIILGRERTHQPLIDTLALDDVAIVIAYVLAKGSVSSMQLIEVLQQTLIDIPAPLRTRLEQIQDHWIELANIIIGEQVRSLRRLIDTIRETAGNAAEIRAALDEAFVTDGQLFILGDFHLDNSDIQSEIANSFDPDPSVQEAVLARVYVDEPELILAAIALLYAGLDAAELDALIDEYASASNPLGDYIANTLKSQWELVSASVLEKRHDIQIDINAEDYMAIPNAAETYRETRYLSARADISADIALILQKLPPDIYLRHLEDNSLGALEFFFETADDLVGRAPITTPLGLNIADVHFNDLFGRSILGTWNLSFTYKGNRPPLPSFTLVELEFLHTYIEQD